LLLAAALFAISVFSSTAHAQSTGIRLDSSGVVSEFPSGIRIRASASGDNDIASIAVRLNVGLVEHSAFNYIPVQPGRQVAGELLWRTDTASSYIPPGTELTYSFEIVDTAGNRLQTPRQTMVYHDPRFEWSEISRGPVKLAYHGSARSSADQILNTIVDTLAKMGPILGADTEAPIRVTVFNSVSEMRSALATRSAVSDSTLVTEGQAFNEMGTLLVLGGNRGARGTASHEVTHILVHRAGEGLYRMVPSWLHEGLAEYGNVSTVNGYESALRSAIRNDKLLPITYMGGLPGPADQVLIFYGQSRAMVRYMIDEYGAAQMRTLLAAYKGGKSMDDALKEAYGVDREGMENLWRKSVGGELLEAPDLSSLPTPVPYPTLMPYTLTPYPFPSAEAATPTPVVTAPSPSATAVPTAQGPASGGGCNPRRSGGPADGALAMSAVAFAVLVSRRKGRR